jgi:hypothetical protein
MIKIREDEIDKEERSELLKNCKSVYDTTSKDAKNDTAFNVFKQVDQTNMDGGDLNALTSESVVEDTPIRSKGSSTFRGTSVICI